MKKCKVVTVSTTEPTRFCQNKEHRYFYIRNSFESPSETYENKILLIISNDKIEKGDWVYSERGTPKIQRYEEKIHNDVRVYGWNKIIGASVKNVSNPLSELLMVNFCIHQYSEVCIEFVDGQPTLNPNGTLKVIYPKTYWLKEEVLELCKSAWHDGFFSCRDKRNEEPFEDWAKENL